MSRQPSLATALKLGVTALQTGTCISRFHCFGWLLSFRGSTSARSTAMLPTPTLWKWASERACWLKQAGRLRVQVNEYDNPHGTANSDHQRRSEERRVGKGCRSGWVACN